MEGTAAGKGTGANGVVDVKSTYKVVKGCHMSFVKKGKNNILIWRVLEHTTKTIRFVLSFNLYVGSF